MTTNICSCELTLLPAGSELLVLLNVTKDVALLNLFDSTVEVQFLPLHLN